MLELRKIKKDYALKDQEPVHALKGISLKFRKNEFVSILGHSGCGKTTLLNVIGGLDHYDSGNLIIKGVSTKHYTDYDWDNYRNHSIGFVFQSYNLIPHQTILKNVELALTISGVGKEERTRRAKEALDKVGLKDLYNKKPNQMSGGQMQRVAIARALVNNPKIVLADEPTGALDSETSIQIMDILKEVSKTHLVIMVTHNPELAEQYSSRIVRMKDGLIVDDTNPYTESFAPKKKKKKSKKKQASMSFFTATSLSISNLFSKFKRTLLISIAGSIGIIGVSSILGVSCGVNNYIYDMEDDMLSSYPIGIGEEAMDLNSLLSGLSTQDKSELAKFDTSTRVGLDSMISYLMTAYTDFTNVKTNDITDNLVNYINEMPESYYSAITYDYGIDPTNNIFTSFKEKKEEDKTDIISVNGLTQRYIKTLMSVNGFSEYAQYVNLFTNFMHELPEQKDYILAQYDLLGDSTYAVNDNEIMLVVDKETTLTDLILAQMGFYPEDEFLNIAKQAVKCKEAQKSYLADEITEQEYNRLVKEYKELYDYATSFAYEDLLGHEFYYYPHNAIYKQNPPFVSHNQVVGTFSGIDEDGNRCFLSLTYISSSDAVTGTYIVIDNMNNIKNNEIAAFARRGTRDVTKSVLDGNWTGMGTTSGTILRLSIASLDSTVNGNTTTYEIDPTRSSIVEGMFGGTPIPLDNGNIREVTPETPDYYYEAYINDEYNVDLYNDIIDNNEVNIEGARKMKIVGILRAKEQTNFGTLSRGVYYSKAFTDKYLKDANESEIVSTYIQHIEQKRFNESTFNVYVHFKYDDYSADDQLPGFVPDVVEGYASALNGDFSSNMLSIFASFLGGSGNEADNEKEHLRALSGLKINIHVVDENSDHNTYDTSLLPQSISIYPKDFIQKDNVTAYLNVWNSDKTITLKDGTIIESEDRAELTYTDTISLIINVISTLVTVISIALIAFTSLSLVVSCFMIAVITYISVMERVKEIGVIRSLGGRKKDVSRLFTAENLITGLASGVIGIFVTYIIQIIINLIVRPYGVIGIAALPWYYALMMIGISVLLSVLSGAIPSRSASKQDPVIALRTE